MSLCGFRYTNSQNGNICRLDISNYSDYSYVICKNDIKNIETNLEFRETIIVVGMKPY